jgi:hypothetical protein
VTIQDLGSIGEIVGAIATVATLLYLAVQIRHNTRESQAASRNSVSQTFINLLHHISGDSEVARIARRGFIQPDSLDDDETLRFDCIVMAIFQNLEDAFAQWQRDVLTNADWEKWVVLLKQYMAQPGVRQYWSRGSTAFNPAFRRYVEGLEPEEIYQYTYGKPPAAQQAVEPDVE